MNPSSFTHQGGISPAMLNFQQKQPLTLNPSQLLGGGTINPSHLNGTTGGINPAAISGPSPPSHVSQQLSNMLAFFNISHEQFRNIPPNDKQTMYQRYMSMMNNSGGGGSGPMSNGAGMSGGGQSQQQPFERPSSSASTHSQGQAHMMPPPPRPPTAQGGSNMMASQISRPGTSLSHRSPTIPGPGLASMMDGQQRPHSRMSHSDGMSNGFKQGQPQQTPFPGQGNANPAGMQNVMLGNQQNAFPANNMTSGMNNMGMGMNPSGNMLSNMNMNMGMNSMGINAMAAMPGSPRIGGPQGVAGSAMGPPGLPRSISGEGMGGMNMNMGINNMTMSLTGGMGMNGSPGMQRPQSSMGMGGMGIGGMGMGGSGVGNLNPALNVGANMNMSGIGMGMNIDSPTRGMSSSSNPMVGGSGMPQQPHTPMRQGSLPPQTPTPSHGHQGLSASGMLGHAGPSQQQHQAAMRHGSLPPGSGPQPGMSRRQSIPPGGMGMPASPIVSHATGPSSISMSAGSSTGIPMGNISTGSTIASSSVITGNPLSNIGSSSNLMQPLGNPANPIINSTTSTNGLMTLPPLPASVHLNPNTTVVKPVPLLTSLKTIPPLSDDEIQKIKGWMETDKEYETRLRATKAKVSEEARSVFAGVIGSNPAKVFGVPGVGGPSWFERGGTLPGGNPSRFRRAREPFDLRYSGRETTKRLATRSGKKGKREGLKLPRRIAPEAANKPEILVPIRIEFDADHHHRLKESFIWNLNDPIVTPEHLAQSLVEDYQLGESSHSAIVKSIQEQLSDFQTHTFGTVDGEEEVDGVLKGVLDEKEEAWWNNWRRVARSQGRKADGDSKSTKRPGVKNVNGSKKKRKIKASTQVQVKEEDVDVEMADNEVEDGDSDGDNESDIDLEEYRADESLWKTMRPEEFKLDETKMHEEMRILIKLDIIIASVKLDDQFEWDLDNTSASPEAFAEVYVKELGLNGEFRTAIAHSIREQVQTFQKSLFLVGHPSDGSAVQDEEIKQNLLPSLISAARPVGEVSLFTPLLNYLSDGELERTEKERDRDMAKRRKRNNRGRRGIVLPDREPIRTYRTPAIGFPELDASALASVQSTSVPTRRAAAAAASLTIANMVAIENKSEDRDDMPFVPQPIQAVPSRPTPPIQPPPNAEKKNKKDKGLFKAPPFPPTVLIARATTGPTSSTGMDASNLPPGSNLDREGHESTSLSGMGGYGSLLDARANRVLTAKRAKELEREAKEREFVDGQHPNYIDGVWHCSNCGCPESIAIGRRKGPLGDKSQCGTCGKFWHRHRRPRPVEYNPDPAFHSGAKQREADALKTPGNKKKGAAAALRAQQAAAAATPTSTVAAETSEPHTPAPSGKANGDIESIRKSPSDTLKDEDDRAISPVSTASSASEAPLAKKVKINGNHSKPSSTPVPSSSNGNPSSATPSRPEASRTASATEQPVATNAPSANSSSGTASATPARQHPPQWLSTQMQLMQAKYPNDRFDVILRRVSASTTPEWRIKCLDCPGKLYTPGPQETLSNYEVHLKNRQHRQKVNERVAASAS
ncbi:hypothetical protein CPB83DRAFT_788034 [Crepidotus variabilis]|uniref:SNF5-domain-containing protein n=1 Tax=Crepidotus variabilis TaxID=179855 RepID=A0A9P6EIX4_9AGAR|nr:hypothetical protein CPB83DRAFT_788034 [Crepidotus variabilis]